MDAKLPSFKPASAGPDPQRVAEVITRRISGGGSRGSGYLLTDRYVLTAAHVLDDVAAAKVRFAADLAEEWTADAEVDWIDGDLDVALLRITAPRDAVTSVRPVSFGRVGERSTNCESLGFPLFNLREDDISRTADGLSLRYRDSYHALGFAAPLSNLAETTLEFIVQAPDRLPRPGHSLWEGMSGAALWSGGHLIGIVAQHHAKDGPGTLAVGRIDNWYQKLTPFQVADLRERIGLPPAATGLTLADPAVENNARRPLHQLAAPPAHFTGRDSELRQLLRLAESTSQSLTPGSAVVAAVDGMAGVGKTALTLYAAHQVSSRFPDGQLFVDLRGHTEGLEPTAPETALENLLYSFGVPPEQIPFSVDERASLYRDRIVGTRTLIVLDNAANSAQVKPLIPSAAGCLVLVTSRTHLTGLDDAYSLSLAPLPELQATELLRSIAGPARIPDGHLASVQLARLCGLLPLTIGIIGARLRRMEALRVEDLVEQLGDERSRLGYLQDADQDPAMILGLSYEHLPADEQHMFRLLGSIVGPDFDAYAAGALATVNRTTAQRLLDSLLDRNLLQQNAHDRYQFHDLVRAYSRSLAASDRRTVSTEASERLHAYYLSTARAADGLLPRRTLRAVPLPDFTTAADAPRLHVWTGAEAWLAKEVPNFIAAADNAVSGLPLTIQLSAVLAQFLRTHGPWSQAIELHRGAAKAAHAQGDSLAEGGALTELGIMQWVTGNYAASTESLTLALDLFRAQEHRLGQAVALNEMAGVLTRTGRFEEATGLLDQSMALYRSLEERLGEANVLTDLGVVRCQLGEFIAALDALRQAMDIYRDFEHALGQAIVLNEIGVTNLRFGRYTEAEQYLSQALEVHQNLEYGNGKANTLIYLGLAWQLTGQYESAERALEQALALYRLREDRQGQAAAHAYLGVVRTEIEDYTAAEADLTRALKILRDLGDLGGVAEALNHYGALVERTDEAENARAYYTESLAIARNIHSGDEANALEGIARTYQATGDIAEARKFYMESIDCYSTMNSSADSARVRQILGSLEAK